jgi:hypothetical protein
MERQGSIARYISMQEQYAKGTPEYGAYHCIIQALQSNHPKAALKERIQRIHASIADLHNRVWPNGHDGLDAYYARQIELYNAALSEIEK